MDNFFIRDDIIEEPSYIKSRITADYVLQGEDAKKFLEDIKNPDPKRQEIRRKTKERIRNKYKTKRTP